MAKQLGSVPEDSTAGRERRSRPALASQGLSSLRAGAATPASLVPARPSVRRPPVQRTAGPTSSTNGVHPTTSRRMAEQLSSSISGESSTAPHPPPNSFGEAIRRSSVSSQSGQRYSGYSSGSASTRTADIGANELRQGRPLPSTRSSLVNHASSSTTAGSTAPIPASRSYPYLDSIRRVTWSDSRIMWTISSLSSQSGSSYSRASSSDSMSRNSGRSSRTAGDFGASELSRIAHRMVRDGYTQRMIEAFKKSAKLETWFIELDVNWVLQCRAGHTLQKQFQLQDKSAWWLEDLVHGWIRALTITVIGVRELVAGVGDTLAAARFGSASMSAMLVVVAAILDVLKVENLQVMLHMHICVSSASYDLRAKAQSIFNEIGASLEREEDRLTQAISSRMRNMRALMDRDNSWGAEISEGKGEINSKTQMLLDCILLMKKAKQKSAQSHNIENLRRLIADTIGYTRDLLWTKSKLCSVSNLRYLFLLNNSYFVAHEVSEPSTYLRSGHHRGLVLTQECQQYMNSYLDVSWGHVLSCILKSNSPGEPKLWKKTPSSLAKFQSEFHETYQAQKVWKVPDPRLRSLLRENITNIVISGYRDYLKEHPELQKQASSGNNSPGVMEKMLGEIFEG